MALDIELDTEKLSLLVEALERSSQTIAVLRAWIGSYMPDVIADNVLVGQTLREQATYVLKTWARGDGRLSELLQKLADNPPNKDPSLSAIIYALTTGKIKASKGAGYGLPAVPPYDSWFAADRPFVNRKKLREHLSELDSSPPGAKSVLLIDGESKSGKSFGLRLALACQPPNRIAYINIDDYAILGSTVDVKEFASRISGDEAGFPPYDPTKENEAIPRVLSWLVDKLKTRHIWIVIDHCNRKALTEGALFLIRMLASRIEQGQLPDIRLVMVDFDRKQLPTDWSNSIRHDLAKLPDADEVQKWCESLAGAAKRVYSQDQLMNWAKEVFFDLDIFNKTTGEWHKELEDRLRRTFDAIMACKVQA